MTTTERNKWLQWLIDDEVIEKYISKYINGRSDFIKEEAKSIVWCNILESNWENAKDIKSYLMRIIRNQLFSKSSELIYTHLKPMSKVFNNNDLFYLTEDEKNDSQCDNEE